MTTRQAIAREIKGWRETARVRPEAKLMVQLAIYALINLGHREEFSK